MKTIKSVSLRCLSYSFCAAVFAASTALASKPDSKGGDEQVLEAYRRLPLRFELNQGQADEPVKYVSRGAGYTLFLTPTESVLSLYKEPAAVGSSASGRQQLKEGGGLERRSSPTAVLRMRMVGADAEASITGLEPLAGRVNYLVGDRARWRTNIPTYGSVSYREAYPGIDLVYHGASDSQLEYDFVVAPGADPKAIRLAFSGAENIRIDSAGKLVIRTAAGDLFHRKPIIYQQSEGTRQLVSGKYVRRSKNEIGFQVGPYDMTRPLVIDPTLVVSTYLGGSGADLASAIAVDQGGRMYVTGVTASTNFPIATPLGLSFGGFFDAYVTCFAGSSLIYSTYLGGSDYDQGSAIAVDADGNAYVAGSTLSTNFPTTEGAFQRSSGGSFDAFVTKLGPEGSALVYSTYLGGSQNDLAQGIALDAASNAYVSGQSGSTNFPISELAFQRSLGGPLDAFVTKLNATGSALIYSTYLGGTGQDLADRIAVDSAGNAFVTGSTSSTNFPTLNPFQAAFRGGYWDAFVTGLDSTGSNLVWSSYLGGSGDEFGTGVAIDGTGNVYVTGVTRSLDFPVVNALQPAYGGGDGDAYVAKIDSSGALLSSTFWGGSGNDVAAGIAVDAVGNIYIAGQTDSRNFPLMNPLQEGYAGGRADAFVTELNPAASAVLFSTFIGGSGEDGAFDITLDSFANVYVAGSTDSTNFPTRAAFQPSSGGGQDANALVIGAGACGMIAANCAGCTPTCVAAAQLLCPSACLNIRLISVGGYFQPPGCDVQCLP